MTFGLRRAKVLSLSVFSARCIDYSTKRCHAIACRLSVRPSVCPSVTLVDQDHIGWKSWKLIARTLNPAPSLFVAQIHPPTRRGTWRNFGETRVERESDSQKFKNSLGIIIIAWSSKFPTRKIISKLFVYIGRIARSSLR